MKVSDEQAGAPGRPALPFWKPKMILAASKYGSVQASRRRNRQSPIANRQGRQDAGAPRVWIPTITGARLHLRDWWWREIKEGGFLHRYLHAEKARTPGMIRTAARLMDGFTQNPRSDFRRLATIPARLYHRWKAEDEAFFDDDDNLRSLKRDNPDLPVYVGPKRVKGRRYHYRTRLTAENAENAEPRRE